MADLNTLLLSRYRGGLWVVVKSRIFGHQRGRELPLRANRWATRTAAKVQIGKACRFVGQNAIQLHGGMGMTDELAIGHYFKRATMIEGQFGSTDHNLARYEALSFPNAA